MSRRYKPKAVAEAIKLTNGDISKAAELLKCNRSTVHNYVNNYDLVSDTLKEFRNPELPDLYMPYASVNDDFLTAIEFNSWNEKMLVSYSRKRIKKIAELLQLPIPYAVATEKRIEAGRIDIFTLNEDDSVTVYEAKSHIKSNGKNWMLYGVLGQLLYYQQAIHEQMNLKLENIHLACICDFTPDDLWFKSLKQSKSEIHFYDVSQTFGELEPSRKTSKT